MLQESHSANQPDKEIAGKSSPSPAAKEGVNSTTRKPKTPLRKDELEKIAQELKKKLSQASVAAKQLLTATASAQARPLPPDSPVSQTSLPKSSPLKNYYMWRRQIASGNHKTLTLLPSLYSPGRGLPTLTKPSIFLSSLPLKNFSAPEHGSAQNSPSNTASRKGSVDSDAFTEPNDSPIKRRRADSGAVIKPREPHMVLQPITALPVKKGQLTPPKPAALHPSPVLSANPAPERKPAKKSTQTTPTMARKELAAPPQSALLKTPTQPGRREAYNDEEGADLLMYLATSPQVPKLYGGTTPRAPANNSSASQNAAFSNPGAGAKPLLSGHQFIAPAPPLTPKRTAVSMAKTPQNRLTPMFYGGGLTVPGSALPSAGLALTPAGFNMNDYVNFFTPSPGAAAASGHGTGANLGRTLLKTPDFNGQLQNSSHTPVDGKMINFDKAELFGLSGPEPPKD